MADLNLEITNPPPRIARRDAIAKRLARKFKLDEPALRELVDKVDDFLRNQPSVEPAEARRRVKKARTKLAGGTRALADCESALREAEKLLRAALLDGCRLQDPLALSALLGDTTADDVEELIDQLDGLTELSTALADLRSQREPHLGALLTTIEAAAERMKGEKGRRKRHTDREIGKLAKPFWKRERKRIRSEGSEDIGPATCRYDYESQHGTDAENQFSAFFGDLMKELAGWDVATCKTALGRWDGRSRSK